MPLIRHGGQQGELQCCVDNSINSVTRSNSSPLLLPTCSSSFLLLLPIAYLQQLLPSPTTHRLPAASPSFSYYPSPTCSIPFLLLPPIAYLQQLLPYLVPMVADGHTVVLAGREPGMIRGG